MNLFYIIRRDIGIIIFIILIALGIYSVYKFARENVLVREQPSVASQNNTASYETISQKNVPDISVGSTTLKLEIADTDAKRAQGLSGRKELPQDTGLFFVFDQPGYYSFWMKDMNFSIDMIWLDEKYRVVGIKENATPTSFPDTFKPQAPALYVLETNVGFVKSNSVKIGTQFHR